MVYFHTVLHVQFHHRQINLTSLLDTVLYAAGDFLLELLQSLNGTKKLFELLKFMINVMKYNAVYLREEAVSGIIRYV